MSWESETRAERVAKRIVFHLAWLVPCILLLALTFNHEFDGLNRADAMDAAQLGRNISSGHGFATSVIRPISLEISAKLPYQPELNQAPFYPLLLGLTFCVAPINDHTVALVSAVCFLLTILVVFFFARRMFDDKVAALSAVLLGVNLPLLQLAVSGSAFPLWMLLTTLAFFILYKPKLSSAGLFGCGVLFGLSMLTDYSSLFIVPGVLWLVYRLAPARPWRQVAIFAVGLVLILLPWGIRNYSITGSPWFSLHNYTLIMYGGAQNSYPGMSLLRELSFPDDSLLSFILHNPKELVHKALSGLQNLYAGLPFIVGMYVIPFFIAGMLRKPEGKEPQTWRSALYIMLAVLACGALVTAPVAETFAMLLPLLIILAAAVFVALLKERAGTPRFQTTAVGFLVLAAGLLTLINLATPRQLRGATDLNLKKLVRILPPEARVVSDVPWSVAWYGQKTAIWLPNLPVAAGTMPGDPVLSPAFLGLVKKTGPVDAIFLSKRLFTLPASEKLLGWQMIKQVPEGYELSPLMKDRELLFVRKP
jgi:4-amino-4-deoxy-L-arabinose transferase-like glycosyltransferase